MFSTKLQCSGISAFFAYKQPSFCRTTKELATIDRFGAFRLAIWKQIPICNFFVSEILKRMMQLGRLLNWKLILSARRLFCANARLRLETTEARICEKQLPTKPNHPVENENGEAHLHPRVICLCPVFVRIKKYPIRSAYNLTAGKGSFFQRRKTADKLSRKNIRGNEPTTILT